MPNLVETYSTRVARNVTTSTSRIVIANLNGESRIPRLHALVATRAMH